MTCSIELRFEQSMSLSPSLAFRSLIYSHQPKNLSDIFALQKEVESISWRASYSFLLCLDARKHCVKLTVIFLSSGAFLAFIASIAWST